MSPERTPSPRERSLFTHVELLCFLVSYDTEEGAKIVWELDTDHTHQGMSQDHRVLTDGSVSRTEHTSSLEIETSSFLHSAPKIQSLEAELYSMILSQTDNGLCRYTYKDGRRCRKSMHRLGVHCFSEHVLHDHVEEELEELQRGSLQMGDAQIINNQIRKTFVEANLWWCHGCGNFSLYEFMIETHIIQYCDFSLSKGITRPRLGPPKGLAEGQQAEPPETTAGRIPK